MAGRWRRQSLDREWPAGQAIDEEPHVSHVLGQGEQVGRGKIAPELLGEELGVGRSHLKADQRSHVAEGRRSSRIQGHPSFDVRCAWRRPANLWYTFVMSTVSYLDRFLEPVTDAFTPEFARRIVDLRANDELQAEIALLRQRANEGTLTPEEDAAYRDFVESVDVISIIQSKARRFLASYSAEHGRSDS